jgi:hypothetical protein
VGVEEGLEGVLVVPERLGVPLDPHDEPLPGHLEALDDAIHITGGRGPQAFTDPVDRLVVEAVHRDRALAEDPVEACPGMDVDLVDAPRARFRAVMPLAPCYV